MLILIYFTYNVTKWQPKIREMDLKSKCNTKTRMPRRGKPKGCILFDLLWDIDVICESTWKDVSSNKQSSFQLVPKIYLVYGSYT